MIFVHVEEGEQGYGPRLIVRSIKRIKKGEEITVAYTDLLQPKVRFEILFFNCMQVGLLLLSSNVWYAFPLLSSGM